MAALPPGHGYKPTLAYRYVVDETMPDGRVCVRTLGWTASTKGSLKELNEQEGWANARYEEIADRDAELHRPTRWLASDMTPLPEYVPAPPQIIRSRAPVAEIVKSQLAASLEGLKTVVMAPEAIEDDADFGALFEEESVCAEADKPRLDQPGALKRADADEPQQATAPAVSTDRPETDTTEDDDDGWSI